MTTAVISPSKSTWLNESGVALNYGGATILFIGATAGNARRRALLQFDTSSIPAGVTISSILLTIPWSTAAANAEASEICTQTDTDWVEGTGSGTLPSNSSTWGAKVDDGGGGGGDPGPPAYATWTDGVGGSFGAAGKVSFNLPTSTGSVNYELAGSAELKAMVAAGSLDIMLKNTAAAETNGVAGVAQFTVAGTQITVTYTNPNQRFPGSHTMLRVG